MTTPPDPRRGRPSCSALERLEACRASFKLSKGMPDLAGEDARAGTRIHLWLETGHDEDWNMLDYAEQETAEMCKKQIEELSEEWQYDTM